LPRAGGPVFLATKKGIQQERNMDISKITVWCFNPPFLDGPFEMSYVTQTTIDGYIVQVETVLGLRGLGEIGSPPKVPIDIRRERISQLQDVLPSLIGNDYNSLMVLASDLRDQDWSWSGVSFCLETGSLI